MREGKEENVVPCRRVKVLERRNSLNNLAYVTRTV